MINIKRVVLGAVVGISLVLIGCVVPSVYPYYTEKDLVFDQGLVGDWVKVKHDAGDKEVWTFEQLGDLEYKFLMKESDKTNVMSAHLFKLKGQLFLDCLFVPDDGEDMVPPHCLLKVDQIQPTLKLATLNPDWVQDELQKHPSAVRHIMAPNGVGDTKTHVVLTAEPKELQKFILAGLAATNGFPSLDEMQPAGAK